MSGKYAKKKTGKKSSNRRSRRNLWILISVLCVMLTGLLVFAIGTNRDVPSLTTPETTAPVSENPADQTQPSEMESQPAETENPTIPDAPVLEGYIDLGSGVVIAEYISYTGAFMEDRTDEVVSGVLGIRVTNTGEEYIQTMDITLSNGAEQAEFSLSTLFPGETVVVLEKNRMAYSSAPEFTQVQTSNVALFENHPGMCENQLEIQSMNGVINVTNISGEDIQGDIMIYYKNYIGGVYYGGITYRIRIQSGMKAGEIRQGSAAHFNPNNSTIVFVTCG